MASRKQLRSMLEAQGCAFPTSNPQCAATGVELEIHVASLDHKVPRSLGGTNEVSNLHIIHAVVNRSKGQMHWGDFVAMCHAVARQHEDTGSEWWHAADRIRAERQHAVAETGSD